MLIGRIFFFICGFSLIFFVLVGPLTQEVGGKCKATGLNPSINPYQYIYYACFMALAMILY